LRDHVAVSDCHVRNCCGGGGFPAQHQGEAVGPATRNAGCSGRRSCDRLNRSLAIVASSGDRSGKRERWCGTPKSYVKTAESRNRRRHAFCGDCGTPVYACAVDDPQSYSLRIGTITQRAAFSPKRQIWRRSALDWVDKLAAVPGTEKG
jgi:hypothetical protein